MNEKRIVNILNGQAMYDYFKRYQLDKSGAYVPFNEAMCVGDVTEDIFSNRFIKCRCDAFCITIEQYNDLTLKPLQIFFENQFEAILLWFDDDMFCQINLLTLLAYLEQMKYSGEIAFNLVDRKFKVIDSTKLSVEGWSEIYKQVMIRKCFTDHVSLSTMEKGIKLYFEYLKEENEITEYIRQHGDMQRNMLAMELLKTFPQYGLGDLQYFELIDRCRQQ